MLVSLVKFIQYCLLVSITFVMVIAYSVFLESLKNGETTWLGYAVILIVLGFSYLFLIKWIAKYEISRQGVYLVTWIHLMVMFFSMFLPLYVFLFDKVTESYVQYIFGSLMILILIICYFMIRKWDIILLMRKRYYRPHSYSNTDWYKN